MSGDIQDTQGLTLADVFPLPVGSNTPVAVAFPNNNYSFYCGPLRLPNGKIVQVQAIYSLMSPDIDAGIAAACGFASRAAMISAFSAKYPSATASTEFMILRRRAGDNSSLA